MDGLAAFSSDVQNAERSMSVAANGPPAKQVRRLRTCSISPMGMALQQSESQFALAADVGAGGDRCRTAAVVTSIVAQVWMIGSFIAGALLVSRPLAAGIALSSPWFWFAWIAAKQGCPFDSLCSSLLWLCVYMHWQRGDFPARSTP